MTEVWSTTRLTINGMTIDKDKIEIADVIEFARGLKLAKFIVKDAIDGRLLTQRDFPFAGSIVIEAYNEAGLL